MTLAELVALGGTPDGTKFLKDDGTLAVPAGGGSSAGGLGIVNHTPKSGFSVSGLSVGLPTVSVSISTTFPNFWPMRFPADMTPNAVIIEVKTAATAGATGRIGLWEAGSDGLPGTLVYDSGTFLIDSTGEKTITIASLTVAKNSAYVAGFAPSANVTVEGYAANASAPSLVADRYGHSSTWEISGTYSGSSAFVSNLFASHTWGYQSKRAHLRWRMP